MPSDRTLTIGFFFFSHSVLSWELQQPNDHQVLNNKHHKIWTTIAKEGI